MASIEIKSDTDKLNSNYYAFCTDLENLFKTSEYSNSSLVISDCYSHNKEDYFGGSTLASNISLDQVNEIDQLADKNDVTRLEYIIEVVK